MDLRHFRYFVAVAEELSFTRAAERLHIGQPPLSMHIKAMEAEIGAQLFSRNRRKVELTPAGRIFLDKVRKVIAGAGDAIISAQRAAQGQEGTLRIAFSSTPPLLPAFHTAIRDYKAAYPFVTLDLSPATTAQQLDGLLTDRFDIGFFRPSPFLKIPSDIETVILFKDHLSVVMPATHGLAASQTPIAISALQTENFVFFPPDAGTGVHDHVLALCSHAGFLPKIVQAAKDVSSILGLVAAGLGISILPQTLRQDVGGLVFRKIAGDAAASHVLLAVRRDELALAVRNFLSIARACGAGDRSSL